ncbi:hypothetical protein PMSD_02695 [Paenibacillus macquariensis subsp. defensor]|nr:hypothetical protein PMSD_02695 [Paenibacillus macquariensis subsp. defensor]
MKKNIIVITDYIEGQPVVASVRYAGIMKYFKDKYTMLMINDVALGSFQTQFSEDNYKFTTPQSVFTQSMQGQGNERTYEGKTIRLERILRHKWIVSAWRNYKYSEFKFKRMNKSLFNQLDRYLKDNEVDAIWVTIPDIFGLYVLDYIKRLHPHIPAIIEIRDIINHNIGEGNPKIAYKRAEQLISKYGDGVVALSQGIQHYYHNYNDRLDIQLIKNGYDEQYFTDSEYQSNTNQEKLQHLTFAHIGSIYKGRSIKPFIEGLLLFYEQTGTEITFNIVGLLDQQALDDIHSLELSETGVSIKILGSVEHEEAIELLKAADVAVILTHIKGSDYAIPGKTFEYIGACKPIIAVSEDQELVVLVHGKYGECAKHEGVDIANRLMALLKSTYDYSNRAQFSRKSQAEQLIRYLEDKMKTMMDDYR